MADHDLIEQYLADLRRELGRIRRVGAICAETRDHLLASTDRHRAAGMDHRQAPATGARRLRRRPRDRQDLHRHPQWRHAADPLHRAGGSAALVAAALWATLAVWALTTGSAEPWLGVPWPWTIRMLACAFTFWTVAGLVIRHGGANGALGGPAWRAWR